MKLIDDNAIDLLKKRVIKFPPSEGWPKTVSGICEVCFLYGEEHQRDEMPIICEKCKDEIRLFDMIRHDYDPRRER